LPQLIKHIIQYRELRNDAYSRLIWELDEPTIYQYAVGHALPNLVPGESEIQIDKTEIYDMPLFNKKNHTKIIDPLGQHGLLHIQLMPGKFLESIFVDPAGISIDLILANDGALIYEFYNASLAETVAITTTCATDKANIYSKIKMNPDDLEYRQYFVRKALKMSSYGDIDEPKVTFPEIMTAQQVALYLQLSLSTVRNKTSTNELPSIKVAGSRRYRKSDIDKLSKK
jgi:excisionase family DNA binding protein